MLENNIEVIYVLFSRNGNDNEVYNQLVSAWCSEDRVSAINRLYQGEYIDMGESCPNPIAKNLEYAGLLSVEGTPTIFLEDGRVIPGYQSYQKIIEFINN